MAGRMKNDLAELAEDHATAIDLIDLNMKAIRANWSGCPGPAEVDEWARLVRVMRRRNSPVVMFLIRVIADLGMALPPGEPERLIGLLRTMAATRMDEAEKAMEELGRAT